MHRLLMIMLVSLSLKWGTATDTNVYEAKCVMDPENSADWQMIGGTIRLRQVGDGPVVIHVKLSGFNTSDGIMKHGFHIHENPVTNKCNGLGPHWNPLKVNHGGRYAAVRHVGDFGNLVEQGDEGLVYDTVSNSGITLVDKPDRYTIIGRSLDVHVGEDDLGLGNSSTSLYNGNAGSKVACCTIELATAYDFIEATCRMEASSPGAVDTQVINGTVTVNQLRTGGMTMYDINLHGFDANDGVSKHGFHVHKNGSTDESCKSADGHYNPMGVYHGAPANSLKGTTGTRHVGDLGNVDEADGKVMTTIADMKSGMDGDHSILNKALVIHAWADDLGMKNTDASRGSGDAGMRLGCCVITQTSASILDSLRDGSGTTAHGSVYIISLLLPVAITLLGLRRG